MRENGAYLCVDMNNVYQGEKQLILQEIKG